MADWNVCATLAAWIVWLSEPLDARIRWRLGPLLFGVLWACGRRTVSRWIAAAGLADDWQRYDYFLEPLGRKAEAVSKQLLRLLISQLPAEHVGEFVRLALDDTPTKRYGPHVEGAGLHHDPTPGPAGGRLLYGHVWVTLSWLVRHPRWGAIGLPLRSLMSIRQCDLARLWHRRPWSFRTKLEMAAERVEWAAPWLKWLEKRLLIVCDGAYAKRPFLSRAMAAGTVVVSRLRKDAALFDLPPAPPKKARGRSRKYGLHRINLAHRGRHRQGWTNARFTLYSRTQTKRFKTFLGTYPPVGGMIRVVMVREEDGSWIAFFSTDPSLSVATILEAVADRAAIEQNFHDLKEVHGAGEQQVRNVWVNVAAWHLPLWLFTLIELWAWPQSDAQLVDRSGRPWDHQPRRPSHADRRNALRRQSLGQPFSTHPATTPLLQKSHHWFAALVQLLLCP